MTASRPGSTAKVVNAKNVSRGCKEDDDQVPAKLKQGWNTLLIKVTQGEGGWGCACGIKSADGGPPEGVKFSAK